jgi:hypothetical protein
MRWAGRIALNFSRSTFVDRERTTSLSFPALGGCWAGGVIVTTLKADTFHEIGTAGETRAKNLLKHVRQALFNVAFGPGAGRSDDTRVIYHPIRGLGQLAKLDLKVDPILPNYIQIWNDSTLEYKLDQHGAEICVVTKEMSIGPFFLDSDVMSLEKVIIHEYLHAALKFKQGQHGHINYLIHERLKYPGPPNPANPSEGWNQPL